MILLDSCVVLDILFGADEAEQLSQYLDHAQDKGEEIAFLNLCTLESASVIAVRFKEKKLPLKESIDKYLEKLLLFQTPGICDDLTPDLIAEAARIKAAHGASMVDCYLIANAQRRKAEIITADKEILTYTPHRAKLRKITSRFSGIRWRN
jgi:predicted nucleic acid-binding protein